MATASMKRSAKDDKINLYTTPEWATQALIDTGELDGCMSFWEPCCGMGHISNVIIHNIENRWTPGKTIASTDLHDHGYDFGVADIDFLSANDTGADCIITNPPFDRAGTHFTMLKHALSMPNVKKVCFFMPMQFLETADRANWLIETKSLVRVWSFADRVKCLTKGDESLSKDNTAKHFAWFVFEKGHDGDSTIGYLFKPDHLKKRGKKDEK